MATKSARRVTRKQLVYLEYLIWRSKDAGKLAKKTLIWLIRRSCGLTKAVRITNLDIVRAVQKDFHDISSSTCTTHARELFQLAGSSLYPMSSASIGNFQIACDAYMDLNPTIDEIIAVVPADPYKH